MSIRHGSYIIIIQPLITKMIMLCHYRCVGLQANMSKHNSKKKDLVLLDATAEVSILEVDLDNQLQEFVSVRNNDVIGGANNVVLPIVLLEMPLRTHSRATRMEQVAKHATLIEKNQFDVNKSMFYVVESDIKWSIEELEKRHPHARVLLAEYLKTPFGMENGLIKLAIVDGQHRFRGYEQALRMVWTKMKEALPESKTYRHYWLEVNVRLLKAETPSAMLVRMWCPPQMMKHF